jgi:hypothetical protein
MDFCIEIKPKMKKVFSVFVSFRPPNFYNGEKKYNKSVDFFIFLAIILLCKLLL